jgi:pimeloyl-ACP methyl ester carboxylesterase
MAGTVEIQAQFPGATRFAATSHRVSATGTTRGPAEPIRATVMAASIETPYLAAGQGSPVVVLRPAAGAAPFWSNLLDGLSMGGRVLAPEPPAAHTAFGLPAGPQGQPAFSMWLRAFLDGLGVQGVGLVASAAFGTAALAFTLLDPERVSRVVLVHDDGFDPAMPSESYADRLDGAGQPLLLVRLCPDSEHGPAASCTARLVSVIADFIKG